MDIAAELDLLDGVVPGDRPTEFGLFPTAAHLDHS